MLCKVSQSNPALSMLSIDNLPYFSDTHHNLSTLKSYGKIDNFMSPLYPFPVYESYTSLQLSHLETELIKKFVLVC